MKRISLILYFVFTTLIFSKEIIINSNQKKYSITDIELFIDSKEEFTIDTISKLNQNHFSIYSGDYFDFSYTSSAYWLKFSIKNERYDIKDLILETSFFPDLSIRFFLFSKENKLEKRSLQNYIRHKHFNLVIDIPYGETKTIYIKCLPNGQQMKFPITLWTKRAFTQKLVTEYSITSLYFGVIVFIAINCLILGKFFQQKKYIIFGIHILSFVLLYFFILEIPYAFKIKNSTVIKFVNCFYFTNIFSLLLFSKTYFEIKNEKLMIFYKIFWLICTVMILSLIFSNSFSFIFSKADLYIPIYYTAILLILYTVFYYYKSKKKDSLYFLVSIVPFIFLMITRLLKGVGLISDSFVTEHSLGIGVLAKVSFFYFLIGKKIKELQLEKETAQKKAILFHKEHNSLLEKLVNERTLELKEKNKQLKKQAKIIEDKKEVFRSLLLISSALQRTNKIEDTIQIIINELGKLFGKTQFGIILHKERETVIDNLYFKNTPKKEQDFIINMQHTLIENSIEINFKNKLFKNFKSYLIYLNKDYWSIFPIIVNKNQIVGKLMIKKSKIPDFYIELIVIFLDHLTAIAENKILTFSLEKLANTDALTGAYNRNFFNSELKNCIQLSNDFHIPFSIISIDINGLKKINDVYGHDEGDRLIIATTDLLKKICRKVDILTRLGGDEFVILCPSTHIEGANILADRIRKSQSETSLCFIGNDNNSETLCIHMSIGVSSTDITTVDNVLKDADKQMYKDKNIYYQSHKKYRTT